MTDLERLRQLAKALEEAERRYDAAAAAGDMSQRDCYKAWVNARNAFESAISPRAVLQLFQLTLDRETVARPLRTMVESRLNYITAQANSDFAPKWSDAKSSLLSLLLELDAQRRRREP